MPLALVACGNPSPKATPSDVHADAGAAQAPALADATLADTPRPRTDPQPDAADPKAQAPSPKAPQKPKAQPKPIDDVRKMLRSGHRQEAIDTLRVSWEGYAPGPDKNAALYILGRKLTENEDPEGLQYLERLPAPFESFDELRLLWLARARLKAGKDAEALTTIDALLKAHPNIGGARVLRFERAQALARLGKEDEALAQLSKLKGDRRLEALALRLKADWTRDKDPEAATRLDRKLLMLYPDEPASRTPGMSLKVEDLSDTERYRRAKTLMSRWQYEEARAEYRYLLSKRKFVYDARWQIAVLSLRKIRDNPAEAREHLLKLFKIKAPRQEEAYFLLMRSYMREEMYKEAHKVANKYLELFPEGEYFEVLSYYKAWLPYDHNDCKRAIPKLRAHAKKYSERRSLVLGFHAWCFVRLEQWQKAYWAFGSLIGMGNPVVRGKAHYWRAVAMEKLGKRDVAIKELDTLHKVYPLTYYDMLGQQMRATWEGRDPRASKLPWPEGGGRIHLDLPMSPDTWTWPTLRGEATKRFAMVRRLVELDEIDRARSTYRQVRAQAENSVPRDKRTAFIRFMGHQVEDYKHGWQLVTGGRLSAMSNLPDPSDARWLLAYPRAYAPMVERLSKEFDLPSHFVYGIMRQESRYNPAAISHTDAVGALQMIPPTARKVAEDMGVVYDPKTFPRPEVSFRYSFFYLRKLADTFKSQLVPTAASYNGGPEPIARWMRETPSEDLATLIEEFAYNESRIYCRKVAEHTLRYLYLYEPDPVARGRWLDALFPVKVNYDIPEDVGY